MKQCRLICTKNEQKAPEHLARNPQRLVPALLIDGQTMTQSLVIIGYLIATRPALNLLPKNPSDAAKVRAIAYAIAMDIHPVCNLGVINHVISLTGNGDETRANWMKKFIGEGLAAVEHMLAATHGPFCFGKTVTIADICLMPQIYYARRWGVDMSAMTRIRSIEAELSKLAAFEDAKPQN